jgi:hypothetical protein
MPNSTEGRNPTLLPCPALRQGLPSTSADTERLRHAQFPQSDGAPYSSRQTAPPNERRGLPNCQSTWLLFEAKTHRLRQSIPRCLYCVRFPSPCSSVMEPVEPPFEAPHLNREPASLPIQTAVTTIAVIKATTSPAAMRRAERPLGTTSGSFGWTITGPARNGRICLIRSVVVRTLLTGGAENGA